jgi:hypothetical protein
MGGIVVSDEVNVVVVMLGQVGTHYSSGLVKPPQFAF